MKVGDKVQINEFGMRMVHESSQAFPFLPRIELWEAGEVVRELRHGGGVSYHCRFQYCVLLVNEEMVCQTRDGQNDLASEPFSGKRVSLAMTELEKALYADVCWLKQQLELKMVSPLSLVPHAVVELRGTLAKYLEQERTKDFTAEDFEAERDGGRR